MERTTLTEPVEMVEALLAETGNNPPIGIDPRSEAGAAQLYRRLRDARSSARRDERAVEAAGNAPAPQPVSRAWAEVSDLARQILRDEAKDIEVLAWLTEAETRLRGHAGLADSLQLTGAIIERFGIDLHPRPEEPGDDSFAALAGLNGVGREGALIQPLRLVPLVSGSVWGENSLWTAISAPDAVQAAMAQAGPGAMEKVFSDVRRAQAALDALDAQLTDALGADAPPSGQLREVLADTERCIRRLAPLPESPPAPDAAPDAASPAGRAPQGPITSREEAFAQLLRISAYFRQAEPHSPLGFALETLVRRGRMDFMSLLRELVPDDGAREAFMTKAGIDPPKPEEPRE